MYKEQKNITRALLSNISPANINIESINYFYEYGIDDVIQTLGNFNVYFGGQTQSSGYNIRFSKVSIPKTDSPVFVELDGTHTDIKPLECRLRSITYSTPLFCDVLVEPFGCIAEKIGPVTYKQIHIASIPVMIGSNLCVTKNMSRDKKIEIGECPDDYGGYFIIKGMEKVIIPQDKICYNMTHVWKTSDNKNPYLAEFRSATNGLNKQSILRITAAVHNNSYRLYCSAPYYKSDRKTHPIFSLLRCYASEQHGILQTKEDFWKLFSWHPISKDERFSLLFEQCCLSDITTDNKQARELLFGNLNLPNSYKTESKATQLKWYLYNEILPHSESYNSATDYKSFAIRKIRNISIIIIELCETILGMRYADNRDNYKTKRIDTPGILLQRIFKQTFKGLTKNIRKICVETTKTNQLAFHLPSAIKSSTITNQLIYCLATGNWGVQKRNPSTRTGVCQQLSRLSYISTVSYLRRTNTPTGKDGSSNKQIGPRLYNNTQFPFICPSDTPEGEQTGLVKNLALVTRISNDSSPIQIYQFLENHKSMISNTSEGIPILVNGNCYGYISKENAHVLFEQKLVSLRRNSYIMHDVGISISSNTVSIRTDCGRMITPFLILEKGKIQNDFIEWLDIMELETKYVAWRPIECTPKHTHCFTMPSNHLSVSTSAIPSPECNQSPRNTYESNMGKQSMCLPMKNYHKRFDTSTNILWYPQKPLVYTAQSEYLGINNMGHGRNLIVAIMMHNGYNQDDAIIWNQKTSDLGFMRATVLRSYTDVEKKKGDENSDKFENPIDSPNVVGLKLANYDKIESDGLPRVGTIISPNDIVIGKTSPIKKTNSDVVIRKDKSTIVKSNDCGIVDSVCVTTKQENNLDLTTSMVRIRQTRIPSIGDKFCSKHGQKGTVGIIVREEDMPFTIDGITPDVILNPHAFPSRMTIAQLIEMLLAEVAGQTGHRIDATAFRQFLDTTHGTTEELISQCGDILHKHGFSRHGEKRMYNGCTGELIDSAIFMCPVYYQRLKHMVADKVHGRAKGPMSVLTRQPAEGRSREGGLRFGEMERDCLIAYGAASVMVEKMMKLSDVYRTTACRLCGLLGIWDGESFECKSCKNYSEYSHIELPYCFKLLIQELESINIAMRLRF